MMSRYLGLPAFWYSVGKNERVWRKTLATEDKVVDGRVSCRFRQDDDIPFNIMITFFFF